MNSSPEKRPPFTPAYWPGWLGVGFLWLLGKTPQDVGLAMSRPLGWLMSRLMKSRRRIAERNIEACFPELDSQQRAALIDECFCSLGRMLFEITWCWSASAKRFRKMGGVEGLEYLVEARARGKGVLVTTAHLTCLEMGGRFIGLVMPDCTGIYRPLKSPVLEWYQNRSRCRYSQQAISKRDMRSAVRFLKKGGVLWYAPDQDFGPKQSVFVPFFGIQTATLEATSRLVQMTGCSVVMMFPVYDETTKKYTVTFYPALQDFPSGDIVRDLTRINSIMEEHIRTAPEQYWWIHKRFKTRPEGEAPFYE